MRKIGLVLGGVVFVLTILMSVVMAAEKFAYIDLSRTFNEYLKTQDYDKNLSDKEGLFTSERDKKVNEIKSLQEKMNLVGDKEKAAKKLELETKIKSLQDFERAKETDLRKEQDERMKEILKDIEEAVKKCAQKEGFTMVFNDRVLVYQDKTMDITSKIVEILNKDYKK